MTINALSFRYFLRGYDHRPVDDDHVVSVCHKPKLEAYETYLKSFKFKQALDAVLSLVRVLHC